MGRMPRMRVAFFGLPLAALLLDADGHEIVHAAICRAGALGTRRLRARIGAGRVFVKPNLGSEAAQARVEASRPDLVVSWFWTTRIPMRIVNAARYGGFGVHPSLLPRHRGPDPYFWAVDAGDPETGVTAHRLAEEYDTGALLGRRALAIDPSWSAWRLAKRLDRPSLALMRETARAFASGMPPAETPQDEALATEAPEPDDAMLELRWTWTTDRIVRRVRAASPWPGAYTVLGDEDLVVTRVEPVSDFPRALAPGESAIVAGRAVVRTADGAVALLEARDEDGHALNKEALCVRVAVMAKDESVL
jgi:methionyl-tRNA formyltransferase